MKARMTGIGESVLDYDACAQLWVRNWDGWLGFCQSPEYSAALSDDCSRFMAMPMTYMIGYENLVVGDAAQAIGGKSGLSTKATQWWYNPGILIVNNAVWRLKLFSQVSPSM